MVEVRRAVGVVLHRPCVGNHVRLAAHDVSTRSILPHNLDILAVVGRLDICALIGLRRIRRFRIQRPVCVKVTCIIRRRRRTIHERRQERQCPPLIDAPLRSGRTSVVDTPPCVGGSGVHVANNRRWRSTRYRRCANARCFSCSSTDLVGIFGYISC